MSKKRYTFFITDDLDAGLKAVKDRDGVPEAETLRRALTEYLRKKGLTASRKSARPRAGTRGRA